MHDQRRWIRGFDAAKLIKGDQHIVGSLSVFFRQRRLQILCVGDRFGDIVPKDLVAVLAGQVNGVQPFGLPICSDLRFFLFGGVFRDVGFGRFVQSLQRAVNDRATGEGLRCRLAVDCLARSIPQFNFNFVAWFDFAGRVGFGVLNAKELKVVFASGFRMQHSRP